MFKKPCGKLSVHQLTQKTEYISLLKKRKHIFWDMFPKHFSHLVIFIGGTSESNFSEQVLANRLKYSSIIFLRISAIIFLKHLSGVYTNIPSICNKTSSRRHLITILHKKSIGFLQHLTGGIVFPKPFLKYVPKCFIENMLGNMCTYKYIPKMFLEETCCKTSPEHIHTSKSFGNRSPNIFKT